MDEWGKAIIGAIVGALFTGFAMYYTQGKDIASLTTQVNTLTGLFGDVKTLQTTTSNLTTVAAATTSNLQNEGEKLKETREALAATAADLKKLDSVPDQLRGLKETLDTAVQQIDKRIDDLHDAVIRGQAAPREPGPANR